MTNLADFAILYMHTLTEQRKFSSAGRASALQAEGHRFEPYNFHQKKDPLGSFFFIADRQASKASGGSYKVLLQRRSSHSFAPRNNKLKLFLLPMIKIIKFQLKKTGFKPVFSF